MKISHSFEISKDSLGTILSNVKNKIVEKEIITKKLTPFLLCQVASNDLQNNLESMVKNHQKISQIKVNKNQEAPKIKKDNLNPKDVKLQNHQALLTNQSNINMKTMKKKPKRICSAYQTSRQKNKNSSFLPIRPATSQEKKNKVNKYFQTSSSNKTNNISKNVGMSRTKSQKVTDQSQINTDKSVKKRIFNKNQSNVIKLASEKGKIQEDLFQSFQQRLRSEKHLQQVQQQLCRKTLELKSQRIQKLKTKFLQNKENGDIISFDFDGSILNLQTMGSSQQMKKQIQSRSCKTQRKVQKKLESSNSIKPFKENKNDKKIKDNSKNSFVIETVYKIPEKKLHSSNIKDSLHNHQKDLEQSKVKFCLSNHSSQKNSIPRDFLQIQKQNCKNTLLIPTNQQLSDEFLKLGRSKKFQQAEIRESNFLNLNSIIKNKKDEEQCSLQLTEQDFSNNFQRQTSTIPYLQLSNGISYREVIGCCTQKDNSLVKFASVSQQKNEYFKTSINLNRTLNGRRSFRSYLSFKKNQNSPVQSFHHTFSVFPEKVKSVQSARIHFNQKSPEKHSNKLQNTVRIYSTKNPFIEQEVLCDQKSTSKIKKDVCIRPQTSSYSLKNNSSLKNDDQNKNFNFFKDIKVQSILDHKEKLLLRQKIQRNIFQGRAKK